MLEATPQGGSALLGVEVSHEDISRYGVLQMDEAHNFQKIVEKPAAADAPSNLINVSKYVLNHEMLEEIHAYAARENVTGEYYITEAINAVVARGGAMKVVPAVGKYLDSGTVEGWLAANEHVIRGKA